MYIYYERDTVRPLHNREKKRKIDRVHLKTYLIELYFNLIKININIKIIQEIYDILYILYNIYSLFLFILILFTIKYI